MTHKKKGLGRSTTRGRRRFTALEESRLNDFKLTAKPELASVRAMKAAAAVNLGFAALRPETLHALRLALLPLGGPVG